MSQLETKSSNSHANRSKDPVGRGSSFDFIASRETFVGRKSNARTNAI